MAIYAIKSWWWWWWWPWNLWKSGTVDSCRSYLGPVWNFQIFFL